MQTQTHALLKPRWWMLSAAAALCLLGLALVYVNANHNGKHRWQLLRMPFDIRKGEVVEDRFTAELEGLHEMEVEFEIRLPKKELDRLITPVNAPSPLDINWQVLNRGQVVGQGDCRDYLYLRGSPTTMALKAAAIVLNIQDIKGRGNTIIRGVGQFDARLGEEYTVRVEVGTTIEQLMGSSPVFGVKVNRRFAEKHYGKTLPVAVVGLGMLGLSVLVFSWWALTVIAQRLRRKNSNS